MRQESKEGFCPRCFDFHPFRIEEQATAPGVPGAFCAKCDFACDPAEIPHGPDEAEDRFPDEV